MILHHSPKALTDTIARYSIIILFIILNFPTYNVDVLHFYLHVVFAQVDHPINVKVYFFFSISDEPCLNNVYACVQYRYNIEYLYNDNFLCHHYY